MCKIIRNKYFVVTYEYIIIMYLEIFLGSTKYTRAHVKPIKKVIVDKSCLEIFNFMLLVDYTVSVLGCRGQKARVRGIMLTSFVADKHADTALLMYFQIMSLYKSLKSLQKLILQCWSQGKMFSLRMWNI